MGQRAQIIWRLIFLVAKRFSQVTAWLIGPLVIISLQSCSSPSVTEPLRVGISPYQDIAMVVNYKKVQPENGSLSLELVTLPWEEILPAVASAGKTVDVGYCSLCDYLTKQNNLNTSKDDPVLFIYPAYVFKGGAFVTFNAKVPVLDAHTINDPEMIKKFLSYRIGAPKGSLYQMMLFNLAGRVHIPYNQLKITDTPIGDCILAAQSNSLDLASAGLTQRTEALKRGGREALDMDTMRFADITGFACKSSTLKARADEIKALIRTWFKCVAYVFSDLDHHTADTLSYLKRNASTQYTLAEYKNAIADEYFPKSLAEAKEQLVAPTGKFSVARISKDVSDYLITTGLVKKPPMKPILIEPDQ